MLGQGCSNDGFIDHAQGFLHPRYYCDMAKYREYLSWRNYKLRHHL